MSLKGALVARERPALARLASGLNVAKEGVEELLWPTRCVLCDTPGTLLCEECRLEIPYIDALHACPHCGQAHGKLACIDCNSFMVAHRQLSPDQRSSTHGDQGLLHEESVSIGGSECAAEAQGACMADEPQRALDKIVSVFSSSIRAASSSRSTRTRRSCALQKCSQKCLRTISILRGSCREKPHSW